MLREHLYFGLDSDENLKAVNDTSDDLFCPSCGAKLIREEDYLLHDGGDCLLGFQTTIILLALNILNSSRQILLPEVAFAYAGSYLLFPLNEINYRKNDLERKVLSASRLFVFDKVSLSHGFERWPLLVFYKGDSKLYMNLFVSKRIRDIEKYKHLGVSLFELNLSHIGYDIDSEHLSELLSLSTLRRFWISNCWFDSLVNKEIKDVDNEISLCSDTPEVGHIMEFTSWPSRFLTPCPLVGMATRRSLCSMCEYNKTKRFERRIRSFDHLEVFVTTCCYEDQPEIPLCVKRRALTSFFSVNGFYNIDALRHYGEAL